MKNAITIITLILMFAALLVGSAEPAPGTSAGLIIATEITCITIIAAGAAWLRRQYKRGSER